MLDESCPHHDRLKTLSIDGPEFHIYKSWRTEKKITGEKNQTISTTNHITQKREGTQGSPGEPEPSFTSDTITLSYFLKDPSILTRYNVVHTSPFSVIT